MTKRDLEDQCERPSWSLELKAVKQMCSPACGEKRIVLALRCLSRVKTTDDVVYSRVTDKSGGRIEEAEMALPASGKHCGG